MNSKTQEEINIGIDTSQSQLDIYVRPTGEYFFVENSPEGARKPCTNGCWPQVSPKK
jgi:transposase